MDVTEITIKTALVRSRIPGVDFVINPYLGCAHGCRYCYAAFMGKYARHHPGATWGSYVEVKVNLVAVLEAELRRRRKPGTALLASVCDAYQPVEARYRLTRGCLELLREHGWGVEILTKSPLVTRDLDLLLSFESATVGFSITTDDETVRRILEPQAPPIARRLDALRELHQAGISTWAFLGPLLPLDPERLHELVNSYVGRVLIDALNYRRMVSQLYHRHGWDYELTDDYARETTRTLKRLFGAKAAAV